MNPYPPIAGPGLCGAPLDRCGEQRKNEAWVQAQQAEADWIPVWRYRSLLAEGQAQRLHRSELPRLPEKPIYLGSDPETGRAVFCYDASEDDLSDRGRFADLRGAAAMLPAGDAALLAYARAMVYWQRQHRHCGRCGSPTESRSAGHVLWCSACEVEHYPRSDPSMLCLVSDPDDRALLGRQPGWPPSLWSVLAGFAEPGESIEDCVAREVWEEARIRVNGTRYVSSQPWPFPASLLMGFLASSAGGEPAVEQDELEAARWFSREEVAEGLSSGQLHIPPPFSLSHYLIQAWFDAADGPTLDSLYQGLPGRR